MRAVPLSVIFNVLQGEGYIIALLTRIVNFVSRHMYLQVVLDDIPFNMFLVARRTLEDSSLLLRLYEIHSAYTVILQVSR